MAGATSKTAVAYYSANTFRGPVCGGEICGHAVVSVGGESGADEENSGLLCGTELCGQAMVTAQRKGSASVSAFCGAAYCGDSYCSAENSSAAGSWFNDVYVSYYNKHGELVKVRRALDRELSDSFGAGDDYVTVTETDKNQQHTVTYEIGGATYVYNYDPVTGELLDSTEYEGETERLRFSNAGKDTFGRVNKIEYRIDNAEPSVYNYTYKSEYEDTQRSIKLPTGKTSTITTDGFGRLTGRSLDLTMALENEYTYAANNGYTTPLVDEEVWKVSGGETATYRYKYDANNNILQVRNGSNTLLKSYEYDGLNRMIRENNVGGQTTVYAYDKCGNIRYKKSYAYSQSSGRTVSELLSATDGVTKSYGYGCAQNRDLLTSYNGSGTLAYDNCGNPRKWFKHGTNGSSLGYTLKWTDVSNLNSVRDEESGSLYIYTYNDQGIRTGKVVNGKRHRYYVNGEKILAEKRTEGGTTSTLEYYYDAGGVCGFSYNGMKFYYRKNIQGDVVQIYNDGGKVLAEYSYTAWGKCTVQRDEIGIAELNPYRYRGYYYDAETGLYYLNSRYYDPEVGRFISPDSADYLDPESIDGLNIYAYCKNNPIMYTDPYGTTEWWEWLIAGIVTVIAVVGAGVLTVTTGGLAAAVVTGAAFGAVASLTFQAKSGELNWIQFAIDVLVGTVSGAFSYGVGQIARYGGQLFASWLGNSAISGIRVNKVISQFIISGSFKKGGEIVGGFLGGVFLDEHINRLMKSNGSLSESIKNNLESTAISSFFDFIKYMWKTV